MSGQIFISYSRVDTEFVARLMNDLSEQGLDIWMDQSDIGAGQRWDTVIQSALEACGLFIIVLSPHSVASENVLDELAYVINEKKRIIPILLQPCEIPYRIARIQFVDFTKNYQTGFHHLISEITQPSPQRPIAVEKQPGISPLLWAAGIAAVLLFCAALLSGVYALYALSTPTPETAADTLTFTSTEPPMPTYTPTFTPTEPPTSTGMSPTPTPTEPPTPTGTPTSTPTKTPPPSSDPDLVASGMQYFPDPAKNAQPIDIQVRVTNNGSVPVGRFVVVWLSNQTRPGCDWVVPKLEPGESKNLKCRFTYDGNPTASYWTTLIVDSQNQITESDESNNRRDTTLKLAP
jgi:hypothetical protein